jgi:hypothetical protein
MHVAMTDPSLDTLCMNAIRTIRWMPSRQLGQRIIHELACAAEPALRHDGSTNALIRYHRRRRTEQS